MIRPTLQSPRRERKQRQPSSIGTVFKSIAESFRSQSHSRSTRHQGLPIIINPTVVGGTANQKELFDKIRSSSLEVRSEALIELADSVEEFSISSIPEIWYASKDLLAFKQENEVRRKCLQLMASCIEHDDTTSAAIRLTYYEDIVTFCHLDYLNSTIDGDFDLFLTCLEVLTGNGKNIHDYCLNQNHPLQHFLSLSLLLSFAEFSRDLETEKNQDTLVRLILFIKICISQGANMFDEDSIAIICQQLTSMVLSCSSKTLMLTLLDFIDFLISHGIPSILFFGLIEVLSYVYSFEKEISWGLISKLLEDTSQSQMTLTNLCDMILYTESISDKSPEENITLIINGIDIFTRIFIQQSSYSVDDSINNLMYFIVKSLQEATKYGDQSINSHILQFFRLTLSKRPDAYYYQYWSTDDVSILKILRTVCDHLRPDGELVKELKFIISSFTELSVNGELPGNENDLIQFYLSKFDLLSDTDMILILDYYSSRSCHLPSFDGFERTLDTIMKIFKNCERSSSVRVKCLQLLFSSYSFVFGEDVVDNDLLKKYLFEWIYHDLQKETNDAVAELLMSDFLFDALLKIEHQSTFTEFLDKIIDIIELSQNKSLISNAAKTLCKLFVTLAVGHNDEFKSCRIFNCLVHLADLSILSSDYDLLMIISKLMIRIRRNGSGHIYFANPVDIEGLSAAFNRNFSTIGESHNGALNNLSWYYPETVDYIPSDLIEVTSKVLILQINMGKWLDIVIRVMNDFYDWEIYSFIWSHFCPQLSNLYLFISDPPLDGEIENISRLRRIVCDQLSSKLPLSLRFPEPLTKADLQIAMIRTLTALIAYHGFFSKIEEDLLIKSTVDGLSTSWEKTAIPCIHFLNISCYEIPLSVKKYLGLILIKLQTRISSFFASPHILEFLMALSHLPSLSSDFNLDEYKRIFGISFQFIEFCKINRSNSTQKRDEVYVNKHGEDVKIENVPSTELINITPALSQYLLSLSYSVISSWFLKMKLSERRKLEPFIVRNLILSSRNSIGVSLDDQTFGFLDFIIRFSFSDEELKMRKDLKTLNFDAVKTSRWLCNNSLITLTTDLDDRVGKLIVRKGSDSGSIPLIAGDGRNLDEFHKRGFQAAELQISVPKDPLTEYLLYTEGSEKDWKMLSDSVSITRSIENLDRLPVVQFSKAGIIYIGPGQSEENSILSGRFGSPQYENFLLKVGSLIRLKNCSSFYVGGLDTENNIDGEFAILWSDKITQLVFHTTTLMPNNVTTDPGFSMKKRHVGNNYVNVYFDESGLPFDFNVIKSQFNFINIVITPVSQKYFKVKVYRRNGVPAVFAACHFKMISESKLPVFVRNLVLVCHEFSGVWNWEGQFISNWSRRVQHINKLQQFLV